MANLNLGMDELTEKIQAFLSDEKHRTYTIIGGTVLIVIFYTLFAVIPGMSRLSEASREAGILKKKINIVRKHAGQMNNFQAQLETLKTRDKSYAKQFSDKKETTVLLEEFAQIAQKYDVDIVSITPLEKEKPAQQADKTKQYFEEMPLLITAKSGYHQLAHFVNDLESGSRLITIEDLEINDDKKNAWRHNIRIVLKTYITAGQ